MITSERPERKTLLHGSSLFLRSGLYFTAANNIGSVAASLSRGSICDARTGCKMVQRKARGGGGRLSTGRENCLAAVSMNFSHGKKPLVFQSLYRKEFCVLLAHDDPRPSRIRLKGGAPWGFPWCLLVAAILLFPTAECAKMGV